MLPPGLPCRVGVVLQEALQAAGLQRNKPATEVLYSISSAAAADGSSTAINGGRSPVDAGSGADKKRVTFNLDQVSTPVAAAPSA